MKKLFIILMVGLLVTLLVVPMAHTVRIRSAVVGHWENETDSTQQLDFERTGRYHAVFEHTLGMIDTYGTFDVYESSNPNRIVYTISSIMIDGRVGTVGPSPGDQIAGIWKVEGNTLFIQIIDDPCEGGCSFSDSGDFPSGPLSRSNSDATVYVRN